MNDFPSLAPSRTKPSARPPLTWMPASGVSGEAAALPPEAGIGAAWAGEVTTGRSRGEAKVSMEEKAPGVSGVAPDDGDALLATAVLTARKDGKPGNGGVGRRKGGRGRKVGGGSAPVDVGESAVRFGGGMLMGASDEKRASSRTRLGAAALRSVREACSSRVSGVGILFRSETTCPPTPWGSFTLVLSRRDAPGVGCCPPCAGRSAGDASEPPLPVLCRSLLDPATSSTGAGLRPPLSPPSIVHVGD